MLVSVGLYGGALAAQAADARYTYVEPGLPASAHGFFYKALSQEPVWRLPLAPGETQILRLQEFRLQEASPFYWTRTRLDERHLLLQVQVAMEVWRGPELRWQRSVALERPLRLMGPELRGTGLAIISPLAELPAGALTPTGKAAVRIAQLQRDLLTQAAFQLLNDYSQHH